MINSFIQQTLLPLSSPLRTQESSVTLSHLCASVLARTALSHLASRHQTRCSRVSRCQCNENQNRETQINRYQSSLHKSFHFGSHRIQILRKIEYFFNAYITLFESLLVLSGFPFDEYFYAGNRESWI
nr:hypothetical protein Itr_chr11CG21750 [Ipomoea trifida]